MTIYVVPPSATFDGERMGNEFGEEGTRVEGERGIVAGMMEIGLPRRSGTWKRFFGSQK